MHTTPGETILGTLSTGESVPLLLADRRRHVFVLGQTGSGKTGLLTTLMHSDLATGRGFCFLDPHGDAAVHLAGITPAARMNNVIYLDPSDPTHVFAYNPLSGVLPEERATAAANIVSAFKNIWAQSWGPRLEYILTNSLRLLLETKDQTLLGVIRLLIDDRYREFLVARCSDPIVRAFWRDEFAGYDTRFRNEAVAPIQNKIGILLGNPFLRSILCQRASTIDIPCVMNEGKALIVNLSKGNLGIEPSHLLGALLVAGFAQAAEARRRIPEEERRDFTLFVDEFQNFATDSFASILSEARKWRLSLVAANQHVSQLPENLRSSMFGNAGTLIVFRIGAQDADSLASELGLANPLTLTQTANYHAWVRLMSHGAPREPRFMATIPPPAEGRRFESVRAFARARHMRQRPLVEAKIERDWSGRNIGTNRRRRRRNPDA